MTNEPVFRSADTKDENIAGSFFGQSSFANLSVVKESCCLPAKDLIGIEEELKLFAPLGCGLQTGAGAVLNAPKAVKGDSVMVIGLGGVGLSSVMAAELTGCKEVIGVDILASRVEFAKSVGATKAVNTKDVAPEDLTRAMQEAANDGLGPDVIIDTSGYPPAIESAYYALAKRGTLVFVGANNNPEHKLEINVHNVMRRSIRVMGTIEGESLPEEFIPQLIKYYREGKFPIDRITKYYKAEDFKTALHDMHTGETIKPVLLW